MLRKPPGHALKPPFDRAAQLQNERTGTTDGKPVTPKEDFDKAAKPPIDLTEAFNNEVDQRRARDKPGPRFRWSRP